VDVRVVPSIRDVAPDAWDAMLGDGGFYQSHAWLTFVEAEGTARTAYVCVWQGDRLLLGLPLYDVRYETVDGYRMERYERQLGVSGRHLFAGARRGSAPITCNVAPVLRRTSGQARSSTSRPLRGSWRPM